MNNYYQMRDAKVRIANELMNRGWKVYNYKEDESDSMTDYFSPADWSPAIAEKNGFILCVDINNYDVKNYAGQPKYKYNYNKASLLTEDERRKVEALKNMTVENGATEGEAENAKILIEKILNKQRDEQQNYTIEYIIPTFQVNPGRAKWHIEKDGKIYDKGAGITKFADIPNSYMFDIAKMEFKTGYKYYTGWENGEQVRKERELTEQEKNLITEFKNLILRWERIANGINVMGDGTKETEQKALEQQQNEILEKVIEKVVKKVVKPVEVTSRENIKINDILTFNYHGGYWLVTDIWANSNGKTCITYEILGKKYQRLKNGKRYYDLEEKILKNIKNGHIKVYTLEEIEEVVEVEKWVRKKECQKQECNNNNEKTEQQEEQATSRQLWALHCATKLDTRNLRISKKQASELINKSMQGENITDIIKGLLNIVA